MSQRGAPAAYRGYRLQALYILDRVLDPAVSDTIVFHPEGKEDLDVWEGDEQLREVVQVKSYDPLTLSDLSPVEAHSFFKRAVQYLQQATAPSTRLINFGSIGPELHQAWAGDQAQRSKVAAKLRDAAFTEAEIQTLFERVELLSLDERQVYERVIARLRALPTGADPERTFELLMFWLYRISEQQTRLTRQNIIERITEVARFLAARYAYHQEWFTTITPLEDIQFLPEHLDKLRREFYAGVSTRYEHVLAGLDFLRERKLREIEEAFHQNQVVIVHAASGEGKTAIAFRYLLLAYPSTWRLQIELIKDRQHVLSIVRALAGFVEAVQTPMAIYIDVSPRDADWPELVQRLVRYPHFHVLVTIREEDLRRANISGADFSYSPVALRFDAEEGRELFERVTSSTGQRRFLDFDAAWDAFGESGPLLEFVYMLTQTTTLRERLSQQLNRIRDEVRRRERSPDELQLLRLVALGSSYEARLEVPSLLKVMNLPEPTWTLELFEQEYLVRLSFDKRYVEGLHPVRSRIMLELLIDPVIVPWHDIATQALSLLSEADLEAFLLHAVVEHPAEQAELLSTVCTLHWKSWAGIAGVLRVLMWDDVRAYVEENLPVIQAAQQEFGSAWWVVLNLDVAGVAGNVTDDVMTTFGELFSAERRARIEAVRRRQTPKDRVFQRTQAWLASLPPASLAPLSAADWAGVAEVWFWLARFDIPTRQAHAVSEDTLTSAVHDLDLSTLADVSLALHVLDADRHTAWMRSHSSSFHSQIAQEYQIISLEERTREEHERILKAHFLLITASELDERQPPLPGQEQQQSSESLHEQAIERIELVRRLFPSYDAYGSQGYGHTFGDVLPLPVDDTFKDGVVAAALHPAWLLRLNIVAHGLARQQFRPDTWDDYVHRVLDMRQAVVTSLSQLIRGLVQYHRQGNRSGKSNVFITSIDSPFWLQTYALTGNQVLLPKSAVDQWGFGGETQSESAIRLLQHTTFLPLAIANRRFMPYFKSERDYTSSLHDFFKQTVDVLVTNVNVAHLPSTSPQRERLLELLRERGIETDWAHPSTYNVAQAKRNLEHYQHHFHELFSHMVDESTLAALEQQEREILARLWPLWYFFAHEPGQRWASPLSQIPAQVRLARQRLNQRYQDAIRQMVQPGVQIELLENMGGWNGSPAYWLHFDVEHPEELYLQFEVLVLTLRVAIGTISYQELMSYVLQETCEYTVIVPTVRGRALNRSAWRLHTRTTVLSEPEDDLRQNQWKYIQQPIPDESWQRLNILVWDTPEIERANRLSTALAETLIRVAQLAELSSVPGITKAGDMLMLRHVKVQSDLVHQSLQVVFDIISAMAEQLGGLSEEELQQRYYLREAVQSLHELPPLVLPTDASDGVYSFPLSDLPDYVHKLEQAVTIAESVRLYWIANTLNNLSDSKI